MTHFISFNCKCTGIKCQTVAFYEKQKKEQKKKLIRSLEQAKEFIGVL